MPQTVVHKASPGAVESVLMRLHEHEIDAVAVDHPNAISLLFSFGTYRIRIAVPTEQEVEARRILTEWELEAEPKIRELARTMRVQFLQATLVTILLGVVLFFAVGGPHVGQWLPYALIVIWALSLFAMGWRDRLRARNERQE